MSKAHQDKIREIDRADIKGISEYTMWYVKDGFHMAVVIAEKNEEAAYIRFHNLGFRGWIRTALYDSDVTIMPKR